MVLCPKCGCFVASITSLTFHLKLKHSVHVFQGLNSFDCRNCTRDFANWKSYRTHLINFHKAPVLSSDKTSCSPKSVPVVSTSSTSVNLACSTSLSEVPSDCDVNLENNSNNHSDLLESTISDSSSDSNSSLSIDSHSISSFQAQIKSNAEGFLQNIYSEKNVTRKCVQNIVMEVEELVGNNNSLARNAIQNRLSVEGVSPETQMFVNNVFNSLEHPFRSLTSDYLRLKNFKSSPLWVEPQELVIGDAEDLYTAKVIPVSVKMAYISVSGSLKGCLETPGVFHSILDYMGRLSAEPSGIISNFIQGKLWKSKVSGLTGFHFPFFLFFDDFQVNNSLGPHTDSGKLGGLYASLPILPPHIRSQVDNIFVILLLKSQDRELFSNAPVFIKVIDELRELQTNGLNIIVNGCPYLVFFHLGLIIGDNLGLNSMLDFVSSFTANHCCRFCKIHRDALHFATVEDQTLLRNKDNYQDDVFLDDPSVTGVVEDSIWNTLPGFHVCENYSVDCMHDILSGCCHYDMAHIVTSLISTGCFSLVELNFHLSTHNYGSSENKPTSIRVENLESFKFKMSASEMLNFVRNFAVMVGHLVPADNPVWQFYLLLRKIIDVVFCPIVTDALCTTLESLVEEHHHMYFHLFKDTLKPKHHNMVHYGHIMREVGSLVHTWTMRFESKNQAAAVAAHVTKSRKNICKTLAIREQITQVTKQLNVAPVHEFGKLTHCAEAEEFSNFVPFLPFQGKFLLTDKVLYHSVTFKVGTFVYNNVVDEGQLPIFSKIIHIAVHEEDFKFLVFQHNTLCFNEHFHAYEITEQCGSFKCISINDLLNIDVFSCHFVGKNILISTKYVL